MLRRILALAASFSVLGAMVACSPIEGDGRHLIPVPASVKQKLTSVGASEKSAMMVRIFKEEDSLEVWKQANDGEYKLIKSYEICTWSGELGPKFREGDRQAPEGFYTIVPGLMNPKSNYYLSFNMGFPNKFDRSLGRTGSHLMVHGACSSVGCYAMTDEQIKEIYALARETFSGGNRGFEVQAFPFRMTPENMAKHVDSPHYAYWQNLKQGYDFFEVSKRPPSWDACNGKYVFFDPRDPQAAARAANTCAPITADQSIITAFNTKQSADAQALSNELTRIAEAKTNAELKVANAERVKLETAERSAAINSFVSGLNPFGTKPAATVTQETAQTVASTN